jgi:hypothetical protein
MLPARALIGRSFIAEAAAGAAAGWDPALCARMSEVDEVCEV